MSMPRARNSTMATARTRTGTGSANCYTALRFAAFEITDYFSLDGFSR
jgi:hypothetical protein